MSDDFDPSTVSWVLTADDLGFLLGAIETCTEVFIDLETTGLDEHAVRGGIPNEGYSARIALASLTLPQADDPDPMKPTTWEVPLSHPDSPFLGRWRDVITGIARRIKIAGKPITNQNVKFDLRWLKAHAGEDLSHQVSWDTRASSHLLDENASTKLKVRAPITFGVPPWDDFDLSTPGAAERVPLMDLGMYAARDTYWTWRLACLHREQLNLTNPEEPQSSDDVEAAKLGRLAVWVSMPTIATLTAIEQRGITLDVDWVKSELAKHRYEAEELEEKLATRYEGVDPEGASFAPTSNWFRDWTGRAVEEGDLRITAMTDNGRPSWGKGVLLRQARAGSEVAAQLLEYRGHAKKAEYLASWLNYVTPDGLIHCSYNAGRVVTGRLSCDSPNLQQVTAVLKQAYVPREGYYLAELDQSQVEMRVAAFISRCKPMMQAFINGWDLHAMLAAKITGKLLEDVTPTERQAGKSANFGLLFTMGPFGFQQYAETVYGIAFTMEEATLIYHTFYEMWDGIAQWHARAINRAQNTGQVISPIGRVRRLPHIYNGGELGAMAERQAVNSPVQGFASDILLIGASSIEGTMPGHNPVAFVRLIGTVHDSLLIEVPIDNWEDKVRECIYRMTTGVLSVLEKLDCHFDVPLVVEAKVGTRWGLSDIGVIK